MEYGELSLIVVLKGKNHLLWNKFIKFLQDKFFSSNKYDDLIDKFHEEVIIDDDDLEIIQNEYSSNYSKDDDLER